MKVDYTADEVMLILQMLTTVVKLAMADRNDSVVQQGRAAANDLVKYHNEKTPYNPFTLELILKTIPAFCAGCPENDPVIRDLRETHKTTLRIINAAP